MSRRKLEFPNALELLLDTICNTFGAVIFISILLSLVVDEHSSSRSGQDSSGIIEKLVADRQQEIALAKARHIQLSVLLQQQKSLIDKLSNSASRNLAAEVDQATRSRSDMLHTQTRMVEALTNSESEMLRKGVLMEQAKELRDRLRTDVSGLSQQLSNLIASSGRTATVSRVRPTNKSGYAYMLHAGRLHRTISPSGDIDLDDCSEENRDGITCLVPKPGGGLAFPATPPKIESRFRELDPKRHFVRLFVSPNSFPEFIPVKDALIRKRFEYEVRIFDDNDAALYLSSERIESFVQ